MRSPSATRGDGRRTAISLHRAGSAPSVRGPRHGAGLVLGIVGAVVSFWLFAGGFASAEQLAGPDATRTAALTALQSLAGGAVLGAVLFAGRAVSQAAPLSAGLTWAAVSVVGLADPALLDGLGSPGAQSVMAHQLGLGLAALLLAGTAVVQPARAPAQQYRPPPATERPATRAGLGPTETYRPVAAPRRPNGPGPRHRAAAPPRWSPPRMSPVPAPRRPLPPHRL